MGEALSFIVVGAVAGTLVGCVGIGGVVIVPALVYLANVPFQTAIPAASAAYIISGIIGTRAYAGAGHVPWRAATPLFIAAMPAAVAGAFASGHAPVILLEVLIGLLAATSGVLALSPRTPAGNGERAMDAASLSWLGAVTGFGSSLTGTGGPLILVPLLMTLEYPVIISIGMAQVIQLPIAVLATMTNAWSQSIEPMLAMYLAAGLAVGTWTGARLANAMPRATLKRIVAVVLILTGGGLLLKVAMKLAG